MLKNLTNTAFGQIFVSKLNKDEINKIGGNNLGDELDSFSLKAHKNPESVTSMVAKSDKYDATVFVTGEEPKIHIALTNKEKCIGWIILSNEVGQEMCKLLDYSLSFVKGINPIPKTCDDVINLIDEVVKEHISGK